MPSSASIDHPIKTTVPRPPAPRLKLVVRRLPPGLTQQEFEKMVGEEWTTKGKNIDWFSFKPGKTSKA